MSASTHHGANMASSAISAASRLEAALYDGVVTIACYEGLQAGTQGAMSATHSRGRFSSECFVDPIKNWP